MMQVTTETRFELRSQSGDSVDDELSNHLVKSISLREFVNHENVQPFDVNCGSSTSRSEECCIPGNGSVNPNTAGFFSPHSTRAVSPSIASSFSADTLRPVYQYFAKFTFSDTVTTPFDSDLLITTASVDPQRRRKEIGIHSNHTEAYPEHLNPFSDNHISTHSLLSKAEDTIVTPFDDFADDYNVIGLRLTCLDSGCLFRKSKNDQSSKSPKGQKRLPPPRPPKLNEALLATRSYYSGLGLTESDDLLGPFDKSHSLRGTCRSSSAGVHRSHISQRTTYGDTKSVIIKRQAPPLPVPKKRVIKADPDDQFISCGELNRKLYEIHQNLTETERSSRALHMCIKQASSKSANINKFLKQWSALADTRDNLLKQEANLLERLHRQELEEQHADVEHELRKLMAKQDNLKTAEEKSREERLLRDLVSTVDRRAQLVDRLENDDCLPESVSRNKSTRPLSCLCAFRLGKKSKSLTRTIGIPMKFPRPMKFSSSKSCLRNQSHDE